MNDIALLKSTEAAVVARVTLRDINRAIDESILPSQFTSLDNGRQIWAGACWLVGFYLHSAGRLTAEERMKAIHWAEPRVEEGRTMPLRQLAEQDWIMHHDFLTIDLRPFVADSARAMSELEAARDTATSSNDVLGGTLVFRGTRIPIYDVAALSALGHSNDAILAMYPALDARRIGLAKIYAEAYPQRGRPKAATQLPTGSRIIADRRVTRRRQAN